MSQSAILDAIRKGDVLAFEKQVGQDSSLRNGPNAFGSWLHYACDREQFAIVEYLVANGADVNMREDVLDAGPIVNAVLSGNLGIVQFLLAHGAILDVSTPGRNPLFHAIYDSQIPVSKLLIGNGIDVGVVYRSETGKLKNALSYASERGEKEIADLLLKAGCRMPVEDVDRPVWEPKPEKMHHSTPEEKAHEQIIAKLAAEFGPVDSLATQEIVPVLDDVHVAINVIRPNDQCPFLTLFTTGMSDRAMTVPSGQEAYQYAELVMHLPTTWPHPRDKGAADDTFWPFEWLRKAAYYPHLNETWLGGPRTIIASDEPPVPLGPNTKQTCLLLLADFANWSPVTLDGSKTVHFYTVTPLHTEERDFEMKHGIIPLLQRLQERGHTTVVDVKRESVA